jgi:membrane-bound serine protease (ClpP class)
VCRLSGSVDAVLRIRPATALLISCGIAWSAGAAAPAGPAPAFSLNPVQDAGSPSGDPEGVNTVGRRVVGRFVTMTSPIDDQMVGRLTNLALELQGQAVREDRDAVLVLEIEPGSSRFGQVSDIARFLTSADISRVRTVAWLPQTVEGHHVILALACHDIVAAPDARLGDIGRGAALSQEEQSLVLSIVDRRRNIRLSRAVARAMMDPAVTLQRVTLEGAAGAEQRIVTSDELRTLQEQNVVITQTHTIKDAGAPGLLHAGDAQQAGFLIARTAKNRTEVAAAFNLPLEALRELKASDNDVTPRVIAIHGPIHRILGDFVERELRSALSAGADLLIFDIDSPGGELMVAQHLAMRISELDPAKVTTVAWIPEGAWSGGALIAMGCDRILMHPDAQIGDIGVIRETAEGGAFERAPEKIVSPLLQFAATLAKRKNRPTALLQAMIDKDLIVYEATRKQDGMKSFLSEQELQAQPDEWVKGPMVPETREGILLTVTGDRAHELKLADAPCRDEGELRARLGIPESVSLEPVQRTWVDSLVTLLNSGLGGFFLITIAVLCLYLEAHMPSGLFAIVATLAFVLFFWSRFLGGTAGTLELLLFLMGMTLLAIELFILPGFGVFGVSGILLTLASLIMASHTYSGMTATESFEESLSSLGALTGAIVTVIAVAAVLNKFLPSIPFVNRLILTPPGFAMAGTEGPRLNPSLLSSQSSGPVLVEVGTRGTAASALRPSGKAMLNEKYVDVVSDGAYIDHGTAIEVVRVAGNRIIVRQVEPKSGVSSNGGAASQA